MEFRNIVVRVPNWVGDAVMSMPALHALRERFPRAHISVLARPWVASLYADEPFCDELIPYEAPKGWRGLAKQWSVASELRGRAFDCAILFQNAFEAAVLAWLGRIPVRIGYSRDARAFLLTRAVPVPKLGATPPHQRFQYLELLKRAGIIESYPLDFPIRLAKASAYAEKGRSRFVEQGFTQPIVGVSPGAAYGGAKRWLPDRFAEAAVHVARSRNAAVAVFGSKDENSVCDLVCQSIESAGISCLNFAGRTALSEFIVLAAACEVYLTNDSGPMHITSALGVPTIAIFGATDETATGPTGPLARVVREPVECSPCLLRECPIDHRCMVRVSADRVAEAALAVMKT